MPELETLLDDITLERSGSVVQAKDDGITYAKMQNVSATSRIIGRKTAAAGDPEECTLSEVLDFVGSAAQGDILYRGAATWTRLGAGTSGHFLKTQGAGANPTWAAATASVGDLADYQFVRKASDESVTSSIALQSDDELLVAIGANQTWLIEFTIFYQGATAGDIRTALNAPAGAAGTFGKHALAIGATTTEGDFGAFAVADLTDTGAVQSGAAGAGTRVLLVMRAIVVNGANAGNVTLRWAQGTSSGTATIIKADSYLEARRVA
jgi:hypothetical protein